jgi:hypothetical protein
MDQTRRRCPGHRPEVRGGAIDVAVEGVLRVENGETSEILGRYRHLAEALGIRAHKANDSACLAIWLHGFNPHRLVEKRAGENLTSTQRRRLFRHAVRSLAFFFTCRHLRQPVSGVFSARTLPRPGGDARRRFSAAGGNATGRDTMRSDARATLGRGLFLAVGLLSFGNLLGESFQHRLVAAEQAAT